MNTVLTPFFALDHSFLNVFNNYKIIKDVTTYSSSYNGFNGLTGFNTFNNLNNNNYLIDQSTFIFEYDSNWNYVKNIPNIYGYAFLALNFNNITIYLTTRYGIYQIDANWIPLGFYQNNYENYYQKLVYNETSDHLLVTSSSAPKIEVFNHNLVFLKSISIPYVATDIAEFNNMFFIATNSSYVLVLQDDAVISSFGTLCSSITSLAIDSNGLLALLCSNTIYVYNSNGQYVNIAWASLVPRPVDIDFDADGNFAITAPNGVFLLNTQTATLQPNLTSDNSCTLNQTINYFALSFWELHYYEIFQNPQIQMQITSTSSLENGYFINAKSFMTTCGWDGSNYVLDNSKDEIIKYDQSWNYKRSYSVSNYSNPQALISVLDNITRIFYFSSSVGIYKLDNNFNIINAYLSIQYTSFTGICYNHETNHVLAVSTSYNGIFILDSYLTLIRYYSFPNGSSSTDIEVYNRYVYVSTSDGIIWVLKNETVAGSFSTKCSSIQSILIIDSLQNLAVMCSDVDAIYVYNILYYYGIRIMTSWMNLASLVPFPVAMGWDSKGNFAITGKNGVYIINTQHATPSAADTVLDNLCINKSKKKSLFGINFK